MSKVQNMLGAVQKGRGVLIQVRDTKALAALKGGAAGGFAANLFPDTIDAKVYSDMRDKIAAGLKSEGVDADVSVVVPEGHVPAGASPIWKPIAITLGVGLGGFGIWRIVKHFRGKRG